MHSILLCVISMNDKRGNGDKKGLIKNPLPVGFEKYIELIEMVFLPVLSKSKSIWIDFFAEAATVVSDLVLNFCQLCLRLLRDFNNVELRWYVSCKTININRIHPLNRWSFIQTYLFVSPELLRHPQVRGLSSRKLERFCPRQRPVFARPFAFGSHFR